MALNQTREMSREGEGQQIKGEKKKKGWDKRKERKEEMRGWSGGKRQRENARRDAERRSGSIQKARMKSLG